MYTDPVYRIKSFYLFQVVMSSVSHIRKGREYEPLMPWLNEGLLTSTGIAITKICNKCFISLLCSVMKNNYLPFKSFPSKCLILKMLAH